MGAVVQPQEGASRPLCACHSKPMWKGRRPGAWICSVKESERNARRLRTKVLGEDVFLGRAQSPAELEFARDMLRRRNEVENGRIHA